jgi:hypothetical protein
MTNRDYSKGKIYKIVGNNASEEENFYVGSTTKQYLSQRTTAHKYGYKYWKSDVKGSKVMSYELFDKYGVDNCSIILLEAFSAKSKDELHAREKYFIQTTNCVNKCIPLRDKKEYKEDNRERIKKQNKEYKDINKEIIKIKNHQYYMDNEVTFHQYRDNNRENQKEYCKAYYIDNNDTIKERSNQYRKDNLDKIKERRLIKNVCICGTEYRKDDKARHERTLKHIAFLNNTNEGK